MQVNKAARHFVSTYKFPHGRQELDPNYSTTACKIVVLPGRVPFGFRISMAEDHVLFLAPKSFASKLSKREGKIGVLNNDVSFDVDAGVVTGVGEGESRQGTVRRLVNHVETWKTYDETNFAKSADVTHFIDFGEASKDITDVLRQNELLRYTALSSKAPTAAANSAAEEAVIHTLTHGMAKCTTTVAFHEKFEDA